MMAIAGQVYVYTAVSDAYKTVRSMFPREKAMKIARFIIASLLVVPSAFAFAQSRLPTRSEREAYLGTLFVLLAMPGLPVTFFLTFADGEVTRKIAAISFFLLGCSHRPIGPMTPLKSPCNTVPHSLFSHTYS